MHYVTLAIFVKMLVYYTHPP
eukprot:COSAG04_NODE_10722_length_757_cov_0.960486_1_plen_20_part_10